MAAALTQRRDNAHNARLRFVFSKALAKSRRRADAHLRGRGGLAQPRRDGARRRSDLKTACHNSRVHIRRHGDDRASQEEKSERPRHRAARKNKREGREAGRVFARA